MYVQYNTHSYKNLLFIKKEDRLFISACFKKINIHSLKLFTWNFFSFFVLLSTKVEHNRPHPKSTRHKKKWLFCIHPNNANLFDNICLHISEIYSKKNFCAIMKHTDYFCLMWIMLLSLLLTKSV